MSIEKKDGYPFVFDSTACQRCIGACCCGEPGNVWVTSIEIEQMCTFLSMNVVDFIEQYLRYERGRFSCRERAGKFGMECVFFQDAPSRCSIYAVRPSGCRSYPFWRYFLDNPEQVAHECPGIILKINRGINTL